MKNQITFFLLLMAVFSFGQNSAGTPASVTGTITVVKGKVFTIKSESNDVVFSKGDSCSVSKDISGNKNPFGINISNGWMGVAVAVVVASEKNKLTLRVVKETSNIVINGKKTEHFVAGKKMKIEPKGS